jgi:hypothetical protein
VANISIEAYCRRAHPAAAHRTKEPSMKGRPAITFGLLTLVGSTPTEAISSFCMAPRSPTFYDSKPTKPFCAALKSCTQYDVDHYKRDVANYFNNLRTYADEVDRHYKKQSEYIECLSDLD